MVFEILHLTKSIFTPAAEACPFTTSSQHFTLREIFFVQVFTNQDLQKGLIGGKNIQFIDKSLIFFEGYAHKVH